MKGERRCSKHGSAGGAPIKHGRYSKRYRRMDKRYQALIDQALQDDGLLDARRAVAIQQVLLQEAILVPNGELVADLARTLAIEEARMMAGRGEEINEADIDVTPAHEAKVLQAWLVDSMKMAELMGRRQSDAHRQEKIGEVLTETLMPIFARMGTLWNRVVDQYVPPESREDAIQAYRVMLKAMVVEVADSKG